MRKFLVSTATLALLVTGGLLTGTAASADSAQAIRCSDFPNINKTWFKNNCL